MVPVETSSVATFVSSLTLTERKPSPDAKTGPPIAPQRARPPTRAPSGPGSPHGSTPCSGGVYEYGKALFAREVLRLWL
jgi:hypothetical protein